MPHGYLLILMTIVGVVDWFRRRRVSSLVFLLTVGIGVMLINNGLKLLIIREQASWRTSHERRGIVVPHSGRGGDGSHL